MNRFGDNFLAVPDKAAELAYAKRVQLGGALFFQPNVDFARQLKSELPNCHVVIRNWPDRSVPKSVDDWLFHNRAYGEGGLIVQTVNEVGFGQENIDFHVALLERIKRDNLDMRVGILGLSVGTPHPDNDWPRAERLLRLTDELRDKVHIILHEYAGGIITSGFTGGNPTRIQPETWPDDTSNITLWHVGRYRFLKRFCASKGIPLPRLIIGEFGFDFTGDLETWLKTLQSTQGQYDTVDGWRDLTGQWRVWWPTWDGATAYMKQAEYADKHIYTDREIEAILFYCRWNDGSWGTYQTNPEMDKQREDYARSSVEIPTPTPAPPVDTRWKPAIVNAPEGAILRSQADIHSEPLFVLHTGYLVSYIETDGLWYEVKYSDKVGYVRRDVITFIGGESPNPPPTDPPTPIGTNPPGFVAYTSAMCYEEAHNLQVVRRVLQVAIENIDGQIERWNTQAQSLAADNTANDDDNLKLVS